MNVLREKNYNYLFEIPIDLSFSRSSFIFWYCLLGFKPEDRNFKNFQLSIFNSVSAQNAKKTQKMQYLVNYGVLEVHIFTQKSQLSNKPLVAFFQG